MLSRRIRLQEINLYRGLPKIVNITFFKWAYGPDDTLAGSVSMLRYITYLLKSEDPREQIYALTVVADGVAR